MTIEDRLRHAYLSEYLAGRRTREQGRRRLLRAAGNDARRAEDEQIRRDAGRIVSHDFNADRADLDRVWGERDMQAGRHVIETCQRFRHVLRNGSF